MSSALLHSDPPDWRSRLSVGSVPPPPLNMVGRDSGDRNNDEWNFKDLRGMRRNAKLLKRNDGERKGSLIALSKLPRFSSVVDILKVDFSTHCLQLRSASGPRISARMASRHFAWTTRMNFRLRREQIDLCVARPRRPYHQTVASGPCCPNPFFSTISE